MSTAQLFRNYELLVAKADEAFRHISEEHGECVRCERHCSDCCHAVFALFLIEAAYLKHRFDHLDKAAIKETLLRCGQAEREIRRLEKRLQAHQRDPQMQDYTMARERIRCPLLDANEDCVLYPYRPITCRVYGIPTKVQGRARVCGKAGFRRGESYPFFDLDGIYRDLYILSKDLLSDGQKGDPQKASLLVSVPKAITTPLDTLIHEVFQ